MSCTYSSPHIPDAGPAASAPPPPRPTPLPCSLYHELKDISQHLATTAPAVGGHPRQQHLAAQRADAAAADAACVTPVRLQPPQQQSAQDATCPSPLGLLVSCLQLVHAPKTAMAAAGLEPLLQQLRSGLRERSDAERQLKARLAGLQAALDGAAAAADAQAERLVTAATAAHAEQVLRLELELAGTRALAEEAAARAAAAQAAAAEATKGLAAALAREAEATAVATAARAAASEQAKRMADEVAARLLQANDRAIAATAAHAAAEREAERLARELAEAEEAHTAELQTSPRAHAERAAVLENRLKEAVSAAAAAAAQAAERNTRLQGLLPVLLAECGAGSSSATEAAPEPPVGALSSPPSASEADAAVVLAVGRALQELRRRGDELAALREAVAPLQARAARLHHAGMLLRQQLLDVRGTLEVVQGEAAASAQRAAKEQGMLMLRARSVAACTHTWQKKLPCASLGAHHTQRHSLGSML